MSSPHTLVIVGGGLAGAKAAEAARANGFAGRVFLVGDEPHRPYERPPLSKTVLRGEKEATSAQVHPEGFYAEHAIDLVTDRAVGVDTGRRVVELATGEALAYSVLILATGAAPRRLSGEGADLAGVHYLRTVDDAMRLGDAIRAATRVLIIGAGWIGSEVAASARQMGAEVVLVDPQPVPLQRVLGDEIGAVFAQLHSDAGVTLRLGVGVSALRGSTAVEAAVLGDGRVEAADLVVAGIGVIPRVELAEAAGLRLDNGVVVDEYLAASAPGVYAVGDIANAWHPHYGRHLRVEHWANALNQGLTAGRNATGSREVYDRLPYFFSDQYDLGMEYVGYGAPDDAVVVRGDLAAREFIAFWLRDGRVTATMNVNVWDVVDDLKAIIESNQHFDPARLADPAVPLAQLR